MSTKNISITDRQSEIKAVRRGRPAVPPARMLEAADGLFAAAKAPLNITMETIAAAAGVGKGTLFRAFGSRDGLLDALWKVKGAALREAVGGNGSPLGPETSPHERAGAFLNALLAFKLDNRHLVHAREAAPNVLQSAHYKWMHATLQRMIQDCTPREKAEIAAFGAHALLATLSIDLIEELLGAGMSHQAIAQAQAMHLKAIIDKADRP